MQTYYPATGVYLCDNCRFPFNLEDIWSLTGADTTDETPQFTCLCGKEHHFRLNLDLSDNIFQFKNGIVSQIYDMVRNNPKIDKHLSFKMDIIGAVDIYVKNGKYEFFFHDITNSKLPLKNKDLSKKQDPDDEKCCVCWEKSTTATCCNHSVCVDCYEEINDCPLCRKNMMPALKLKGDTVTKTEMYV